MPHASLGWQGLEYGMGVEKAKGLRNEGETLRRSKATRPDYLRMIFDGIDSILNPSLL